MREDRRQENDCAEVTSAVLKLPCRRRTLRVRFRSEEKHSGELSGRFTCRHDVHIKILVCFFSCQVHLQLWVEDENKKLILEPIHSVHLCLVKKRLPLFHVYSCWGFQDSGPKVRKKPFNFDEKWKTQSLWAFQKGFSFWSCLIHRCSQIAPSVRTGQSEFTRATVWVEAMMNYLDGLCAHCENIGISGSHQNDRRVFLSQQWKSPQSLQSEIEENFVNGGTLPEWISRSHTYICTDNALRPRSHRTQSITRYVSRCGRPTKQCSYRACSNSHKTLHHDIIMGISMSSLCTCHIIESSWQ